MRLLLPCLALAAALALPAAHAQTPAWTGGVQTTNPAPTNDTGAEGEELALDAAGNSYVSGYLQASNGSAGPAVRAFGVGVVSGGGVDALGAAGPGGRLGGGGQGQGGSRQG